jgi:hypothetical protein
LPGEYRGVQKNHLGGGPVNHSQDPVAGGLGLFRSNGNLLAQHAVEQGGFSRIGGSENGHKAGSETGLVYRQSLSHRSSRTACSMADQTIGFPSRVLGGKKNQGRFVHAQGGTLMACRCFFCAV